MTAFPSLVTVRHYSQQLLLSEWGEWMTITAHPGLRCERMCLKKPDLGSTLPKGCADAGQSHYQK